ncbi:MAG: excisionase [Candidatus Thiodiazotropha sp.]
MAFRAPAGPSGGDGAMPVNWLTIAKMAAETGYSENAIRTKIRDAVWVEGRVWAKAPDGRILISVEGYNQWVEETASAPRRTRRSRSTFTTTASGVKNVSSLSPRPLT